MKVTLVLIESHPVFAAYLFGIAMSFMVILISCLFIRVISISRFFEYWGKKSLFLMVTHEYIGIRGVIQTFLNSYIKSKAVVLILTFFFVLLFVYLIQLIIGKAFRRFILEK